MVSENGPLKKSPPSLSAKGLTASIAALRTHRLTSFGTTLFKVGKFLEILRKSLRMVLTFGRERSILKESEFFYFDPPKSGEIL